MTLLEYVQSLQEQGVIDMPAKVQEWKKKNQPKVEEEVVEEVKIDPVVETDASAPGKANGVSETLNSGDSKLNTECSTVDPATESITMSNDNSNNIVIDKNMFFELLKQGNDFKQMFLQHIEQTNKLVDITKGNTVINNSNNNNPNNNTKSSNKGTKTKGNIVNHNDNNTHNNEHSHNHE